MLPGWRKSRGARAEHALAEWRRIQVIDTDEPGDAEQRKRMPVASGVLDYFPDALAAVAHCSKVGNDQHNPGEPLQWAREKSTDHADCIIRHLVDRNKVDSDGILHATKVAWRALALLQVTLEREGYQFLQPTPPKASAEPSPTEVSLCAATRTRVEGATLYIAGPMRGYKDRNFPAFDEAKTRLLSLKYKVISPADMDRQLDDDEAVTPDGNTSRHVVRRDIEAIMRLRRQDGDGIAVLPGWQASTGATAEVALARWLDLPVMRVEDW